MWRMVTEQDGHESVSTVVCAEEECPELLLAEAQLHAMAGWKVTVTLDPHYPEVAGIVRHVVAVSRTGIVRRSWFREYDPATDGSEP